jgi:hypothetical protein
MYRITELHLYAYGEVLFEIVRPSRSGKARTYNLFVGCYPDTILKNFAAVNLL